MKTVPLTVRRCPAQVHKALKVRARANHRSLNGEILARLEKEAIEAPITGLEAAQRMRKARKLLTETEHKAFGEDIERGLKLMRRERLH